LRDFEFELSHPDKPVTIFTSFFAVPYGLDVYIKRRTIE